MDEVCLLACRCMAHSLNLAAKHVLEAFAPTPRHVLAEGNDAAKPAADVEQDEIDEEDGELDENELVNFNPNDLLGKRCMRLSRRHVLSFHPASQRLFVSDSSHL